MYRIRMNMNTSALSGRGPKMPDFAEKQYKKCT